MRERERLECWVKRERERVLTLNVENDGESGLKQKLGNPNRNKKCRVRERNGGKRWRERERE